MVEIVTGRFVVSGGLAPLPGRARSRPLRQGCSIGTRRTSATLGLLVTVREGAASPLLLTAAHPFVSADASVAVLQPSGPDGGRSRDDTIGHVIARVMPDRRCQTIDAAVIAPAADIAVDFDYPGSGCISGHRTDPSVGQVVRKVSRTTGATEGTIIATNWSGFIDYPTGRRRMTGQLLIHNPRSAVALPGDSGAVWVTKEGAALALHFSATDRTGQYSIATPIGVVLDCFNLLVAARPS
jgi:hypothetical protein